MWNYYFAGLIFQNQEQSISKHFYLIAETHTLVVCLFDSHILSILKSLVWRETKSLLDNNKYLFCVFTFT